MDTISPTLRHRAVHSSGPQPVVNTHSVEPPPDHKQASVQPETGAWPFRRDRRIVGMGTFTATVAGLCFATGLISGGTALAFAVAGVSNAIFNIDTALKRSPEPPETDGIDDRFDTGAALRHFAPYVPINLVNGALTVTKHISGPTFVAALVVGAVIDGFPCILDASCLSRRRARHQPNSEYDVLASVHFSPLREDDPVENVDKTV